ncbi:hypothetical protein AYM40_37780 (plasmid) [Paraburkholderia phytofirmans OLGA172]|uniref:Uncharacterized protein n=1 Tax=Paraburkholderia phytofirmans OLGA172 TaxID=1417228 RepID=A0A167WSY2_9BURK|nr:hypothetical protein AYM40_37780 [Paraburkholderia phytofirmans OLGA172]
MLDARAGLHDIGSAAVTQLGAEALLFARNDAQNWWAYKQLFGHLAGSEAVVHGMGRDSDLRWRLKMVAAQTPPVEDARRKWISASYSAWTQFYDDETAENVGDFEPVVFDRDSLEAPHYPLFINFDLGVRSLVLNNIEEKPEWTYVSGIFNDFFEKLEGRLFPSIEPEGDA